MDEQNPPVEIAPQPPYLDPILEEFAPRGDVDSLFKWLGDVFLHRGESIEPYLRTEDPAINLVLIQYLGAVRRLDGAVHSGHKDVIAERRGEVNGMATVIDLMGLISDRKMLERIYNRAKEVEPNEKDLG